MLALIKFFTPQRWVIAVVKVDDNPQEGEIVCIETRHVLLDLTGNAWLISSPASAHLAARTKLEIIDRQDDSGLFFGREPLPILTVRTPLP